MKLVRVLAIGFFLLTGVMAQDLWATNGYFSHGYGAKSKAMGGTGVANPQDTFAMAANPAGMVYVGDRRDAGLDFFLPTRNSSITGNASPANNIEYDANRMEIFYLPDMGFNRMIRPDVSLGVGAFGNGGLNTTYHRNITLFGTADVLSDLAQIFVSPTLAAKVDERHALGVSFNTAYQYFKARGLEGFDTPSFSSNLGHVTGRGHDSSVGWGLRFGWIWEAVPDYLKIGATYQTRTWMTEFKKYSGLFAEQGDFDIPANYAVGLSLKVQPQTTVAFDVEHIEYASIKSLANRLVPNLFDHKLGEVEGAGFGWKDQTIYKVGLSHDVNDDLTLRLGYNYGKQPIPKEETLFNLLATATVEHHLTTGFTWILPAPHKGVELNFAYLYAAKGRQSGSGSIPAAFGGGEANIDLYEHSFEVSFGKKF